ncbi:hypothetical protein ACFFX0_17565 [Citricoccus parietis]|uniref:Uncharacterized protein n=1 Tax=Citricoccus parietis TaxID=592307 RepID=A0ABV5G1U5_9MICC
MGAEHRLRRLHLGQHPGQVRLVLALLQHDQAFIDGRIADLDALRVDQLGQHGCGEPQHAGQGPLAQPEGGHDDAEALGQGDPVDGLLLGETLIGVRRGHGVHPSQISTCKGAIYRGAFGG